MNASDRLNTCKSRGSIPLAIVEMATGARVSNAYATWLIQGDSPWKRGLTPHNIIVRHLIIIKSFEVSDGHASY